MAKEFYSASEAAKTLGISVDTLRRWDRQGRIATIRDSGNRRLVPAAEIERLRGAPESAKMSARNRFTGVVTDVEVDGLMAQVELVVTDPIRVCAVITRDSAERLDLRPGMPATAIVKATFVMIENFAPAQDVPQARRGETP
jgi:molybdopterin-binding protein